MPGYIFEDNMDAQDQNQKKKSGSFHACPGVKGPLSPDEG